jgi:hypothetical protein
LALFALVIFEIHLAFTPGLGWTVILLVLLCAAKVTSACKNEFVSVYRGGKEAALP